MTKKSIEQVLRLQETSEEFNDLSVEQLLWAAIVGSSLVEVRDILKLTSWHEWCDNVDSGDLPCVGSETLAPQRPIRVKILHLDFQILWKDHRYEQMTGNIGQTNWQTQEIWLSREHSPEKVVEVLLHEVFHMIAEAMGIGSNTRNESWVTQFAIGLAAVVRDNPDLMPWMSETIRISRTGSSEPTQTDQGLPEILNVHNTIIQNSPDPPPKGDQPHDKNTP